MILKKKYKIGAHWFKVILGGDIGNDDNYGKSRMEDLKLFIRDDIPQSLREETLIHESLHMIRQMSGIEKDDEDEEEKEVQIMAHGIYQFFIENGLLK